MGIPPYFTNIVPIAQLKPAESVMKKPKIFSKMFISKDRKKIPIVVFSLKNFGNMKEVIQGFGKFTLVSPSV